MNATKAGSLPDHVISIHIAVPVQRVWDEITKTGRVQRALYNTVLDTELRPGAKLRYHSPSKKRVFIVGEIVNVEPPHVFSHTYRMLMNGVEEPTLVTWTLKEENNGTRVTIRHSGWTAAHKAPEKVSAGWTEILGLLKADLETGKLPVKIKIMYAMMNMFMFMLPKTTKREFVDQQGW
jgi:uncharacterized protein YndB with AHSA1/START domain